MALWIRWVLAIVYLALTIGAVFLFYKNADEPDKYLIRNRGKIVDRGKNGKK
jgi:hypothetical protein